MRHPLIEHARGGERDPDGLRFVAASADARVAFDEVCRALIVCQYQPPFRTMEEAMLSLSPLAPAAAAQLPRE